MTISNILNTDSYKTSHFLQYPSDTKKVNAYIETRGISSEYVPVETGALFFGLQSYIRNYLMNPVTISDIELAERVFRKHGVPFNRPGWERIVSVHDGYLPVQIEAVPEGTIVPHRTPLVQIRGTDEELPWVTSYIETPLIRAVWYPTTVATLSWYVKNKIILPFVKETAGDESVIDYMLHDFGSRGASSDETASLGGLAHLISFKGTDTVSALLRGMSDYYADMPGFSIPAAEHSTITAWGEENETEAYANMIDKFGEGLYAVVSDSYDIYNACEKIWGETLKDKVISKKGRLVIRPDSGNPVEVVLKVLNILDSKFGSTTNYKGYRVLHSSIRVIQGDGVNPKSINEILVEMKKNGWSAENIAFGMGGALLQNVNRDSMKFAMKTSAIKRGTEWKEVYKNPVTDPGKASKKGILSVNKNTFEVGSRLYEYDVDASENLLDIVYKTGYIEKEIKFEEVISNSRK